MRWPTPHFCVQRPSLSTRLISTRPVYLLSVIHVGLPHPATGIVSSSLSPSLACSQGRESVLCVLFLITLSFQDLMSLKVLLYSLPLSEMSVLASRQIGVAVCSPARGRVAGAGALNWSTFLPLLGKERAPEITGVILASNLDSSAESRASFLKRTLKSAVLLWNLRETWKQIKEII